MLRRRRLAPVLFVTAVAVITATCDATDAVSPPYAEPVQLTFTGETTVVIGRTVAPVVTAELRGEPVTSARFRFLSADTSVIAMTTRQDSIAGRRRGCSALTIRLDDPLLGDNAPTLSQRMCAVIDAVTLEPGVLSFESLGDSETLQATAVDGDGNLVANAPVQWESTNSAIAEVVSGRVTARGQGSAEILAIVDNDTAAVPVSVAQSLTDFTFDPVAIVIDAFGVDTTVVATARDANGFTMPATMAVWESRDTTVVAVSASGVVSARGNGVTYVLARRDAVVDSLRVEVRQRATRVVITSVAGFSITALGDELLLSGRGFDRLDHAILDATPTWISQQPTIAEVLPDRGLVTGLSVGDATIMATLDGISSTVTVAVRNLPVSLDLTPDSATLTSLGDELTFGVIALNRRGASIPDLQLTWQSTAPQVLSITNTGRATALAEGQSTVIVSAEGLSASAVVNVVNRPASIQIIPGEHTFTFVGDTLSPAAEIRNARGDLLARTSVTWSSQDELTATATAATGLITARGVGQTYVHATYETLRDSMQITVRNDPASVVLNAALDTLTALGQQLTYVATVRNANDDVLTDPPTWRTTNAATATVSSTGMMTAVGYGSASIIATAGAVADTVAVVVVNPTTVYVDNSVVTSPRLGTLKRPFTSVQAGVNVADAYDTVVVRPGASPYSETVALTRRITLLGDSAAFVANGRDPMRLPVITHDTGSAGILAYTRAPVIVRYLTILHSIDGVAVDVFESDAQLEHIYINPGLSGRIGRGIRLRDVTSSAEIRHSRVTSVAGYGIRLDNVRNGRVSGVDVSAVGALAGESGAGIHVSGGDGNLVELSRIRGTAGPHLLSDASPGLRISDNDLAGRHQIIRLLGATGATEVSRNTFNLSRQPEDPGVAGSETDGRSGLEIRSSSAVTVVGNLFTEPGTSLMDAIRLIDARSTSGVAARLHDNRFHRGRHSVRSERSTWELLRSRSDSAMTAISATEADTLTVADDTLTASLAGRCIAVTGASVATVVTRGSLDQCSPVANTVGEPAISVTATNASLDVSGTTFSGQNQTAIRFAGRRLLVRGVEVRRTIPEMATSHSTGGVIDASGDSIRIVGVVIGRHTQLTAINVSGTHVQIDSSRVTRNATGIRIGSVGTIRMLDNDIFDNTIAGLIDATASGFSAPGNWWGDGLGPRRAAEPMAVGDTVVGAATFLPVRTTPLTAGSTPSSLRKVRGDNQSAPRGTVLPLALSARVVDANGRPVSGVAVTFDAGSGGAGFVSPSTGTTIIVATDASGLAQASLQLANGAGTRTVTVTAPGTPAVTFTVTGF